MTEDMQGIPQSNHEQNYPQEQHLAEVALEDVQAQVDENGYLPDGSKPSYVEDVDLAHEAADASNADRSQAALHRDQGSTYHVDFGNNVSRDRHNAAAHTLDARADIQEDSILNRVVDSNDEEKAESTDDHERLRFEKLVEIRAEAAKLDRALSKTSVEDITQGLRSIEPTNAYADRLHYSGSGNLDDTEKYNDAFNKTLEGLTYAQKFGVITSDRSNAQMRGVEITKGWPDKHNPWWSSLTKTVELNAWYLFDKATREDGTVTYTVGETATQLDGDGQLSRLANRLSYHTNTFYARLESSPSIVAGQDKEGKIVAKAYFIVQVGDRSSKDLEVVDLSDVDAVLQLASERMQPYSEEIDESKRLANLVDVDALREGAYERAEEHNKQFIEEFKTAAPEFGDIPNSELYEILKIAATNKSSYHYPENLSAMQRLIFDSLKSGGQLKFVTDNSTGEIVNRKSTRELGNSFNRIFESWTVTGTSTASKIVYKGLPWSAWSTKVEDIKAEMSPDDILSLRKKILSIRLDEQAA